MRRPPNRYDLTITACAALMALSVGCLETTTAAPRHHSAARDIPEPYRYGFVNAAVECSPDWGDEAKHVLVFLSATFGYCPIDAKDPRGLVAGRLAERAHATCDGAIHVLFVAIDGHGSREESDAALEERRRQAVSMQNRVVDLDFVSALPTGTCEPSKETVFRF